MPKPFDIPAPQWPGEQSVIDAVATQIEAIKSRQHEPKIEIRHAPPENVIKAMRDIATSAWKAKSKMLDTPSGEVREEMRRVYRHIEGILDSLREIGLEVKDHTGDPFDYGLPLKVIATQLTPGINRESVVETIKPTVYWQQHIIQTGEVVIATPSSTENAV